MDAEWQDTGIQGPYRFLGRLWRRVWEARDTLRDASVRPDLQAMARPERDLYRKLHQTIKSVTDSIEAGFRFNTAIAQIMELMNALDALKAESLETPQARAVYRETLAGMVRMLAPFTPHVAEELWVELGHPAGLMKAGWPAVDEAALKAESIEVVLQINGKVRGKIELPAEASRDDLERAALADPQVIRHLEGKQVRKVVVVPGRLVNIAAG
jgi:leucyl-tRNA synthetase